ncbi:MAG: GGDEF domain-containing phosphodiesterase [Eubacteriales bacterium]|nr:GGDEF domain-containing phosphodiesterase [Eubacteriales bacterium]
MSSYIIDKNYQLLCFDEGTKRRFPDLQVGDICYREFNKTDTPCKGCRCFLNRDVNKTRYYNRTIQKEVTASFNRLIGPEDDEHYLVLIDEQDAADGKSSGEADGTDSQSGMDEDIDEIDLLTGLYRYRTFASRAIELLRQKPMDKWVMLAIDIEHFKLFNIRFGDSAGDRILNEIGTYLNALKEQEPQGCEVGYWGEDDFYAVLPEDEGLIQQIYDDIARLIAGFGRENRFRPCVGVYRLAQHTSFRGMCDRAQLAVTAAKNSIHAKIIWFEESMLGGMEKKQHMLEAVEAGLKNREFVIYMQPKCNLNTGKVVGLEALVRWKKPDGQIIPPGEYLPYMENVGLITELDLYVWEEACRELRGWMDNPEHVLLPVSVNVSIVDIHAIDVPQVLQQLTQKYGIPAKCLEIEITESVYAKEQELVIYTVHRLQELGFTVLMDDFGSGYSSLNMLKDLPIDILKIDMKFLELEGESREKGISILQSVIRLANLMHLKVIAEGVETMEQTDLLLKLGCLYGQGYYYYRPMPMEEIYQLLNQKNKVDIRGIRSREIEYIDTSDLFSDHIISDVVMNNILGAVAFYEIREGKPVITHINDHYCKLVGINLMDMEDRTDFLMDFYSERDRNNLIAGFQEAYENRIQGAKRIIRRKRRDEILWLLEGIYYLWEHEGNHCFCVTCQDVTQEHLRKMLEC